MRHFFSNKVRVILAVALLLSAGLAILSGLTGSTPGDWLVKGVLTPLRTGVSALADRAEQVYDYIFRYETLLAENEALKSQLAQIQDDARDVASIKRENERLRALLKLIKDHEDYVPVDAYIISRSPIDWNKSFTVNRGTRDGIAVGMCAITENGEMVGLVTEVGANYAVIKSVLDSTLEISATIASSGESGMVKGAYDTDMSGYLKMNYLASSAIIRNEDQVVTAGSTVYPRNLILGYVVDAGYNDTGVAKFALLRPAADVESLEQVFILTAFDGE